MVSFAKNGRGGTIPGKPPAMSADTLSPAIVQLGDPRLRRAAKPVEDARDPAFAREVKLLTRALADFQAAGGFGRGISAPQVGIAKRFIVLDLGDGPELLANPEITWKSEALFTMWDDCMSFPSLLVRVQRHESISIRFTDVHGDVQEWTELDRATSELLQHEIDHLDGILAIDRVQGEDGLVTRSMFEAMPARYLAEVDYAIAPTTPSNRPPPPANA
jgi:peptide deformylase